MSILSVDTISPIGSGTTLTLNATETKVDNFITVGTGASVSSPSSNVLTLGTNSTEKVRIDSSGRLLLGTTIEGHAEAENFTIGGSGSVGMTIRSTDSNSSRIYFSDATSGDGEQSGALIYRHSTNALEIYANEAERLRITSNGSVVVGGDTPATVGQTQLTLRSNSQVGLSLLCGAIQNATITFGGLADGYSSGDSGYDDGKIMYDNSNNHMQFNTAGGERLRITSNGNVDINGTPPWTVTGGSYKNLSISGDDASSSGFLWLGNGAAATNADFDLGRVNFVNGANIVAQIKGSTQTSANDDGRISFCTKATGSSISEKVRITSDGKIGINVLDPDSDIEINRGSEGKYLTMGGDDANNGRGLSFTSSTGGTGSNGALHTINAKSGNGAIALATAGSEKFRVDKDGNVTKPLNAMFKVVRSSSQSVNSNGWHVIGYNNKTATGCFDIGNNFNTSNHRFTAPVTGYYQFGLNQRVDGGNGDYFRVAFTVNGATPSGQYPYGHAIYRDSDGFSYYTFSITSLIYLTAGQYVRAEAYSSSDSSWQLQDESQFYGYLVG